MPKLFEDFIRRHLVDTVPRALDLCMSCHKPQCSSSELRSCLPRLTRAARLEAADQAERAASASRTTASRAPGAKGEISPAEATSA